MAGKTILAIVCSDGRLHGSMSNLTSGLSGMYCQLRRLPEINIDLLAVPGASRILLNECTGQVVLYESIDFLVKTHVPDTIAIVHHENCGYYEANEVAFNETEREQERQRHLGDMRLNADVLVDSFDGIRIVDCWYVQLDDRRERIARIELVYTKTRPEGS